jgi:hypothetical protein
VTEKTLQLSWPIGKTLGLAFVIMVLLGGVGESIARSELFQSTLTPPRMGSRHSHLGPKLYRLDAIKEREGQIDCLMIGSSIVNLDFDPQAFAEGYKHATGQDIHCFNFGIDALTATSTAALVQILIEDYQPRLLIYGTDARDYAVPQEAEVNFVIFESGWIQYRLGRFTLEGWLFEHSYLYRYRQQLYHLVRLHPEAALLSESALNFEMTPDGFLPESTISTYVNDPPDPQDDSFEVTYYSRLLSTYKMLENNLNALEQIMSHNGQSTQVILLEMPVAKGFYYFFGNGKNDHQHFINEVNRLARVRHIPFWQTNLLYMIPDDGWADYNHLNTKGAAILSNWLGRQVAAEVIQGAVVISNPESYTTPASD